MSGTIARKTGILPVHVFGLRPISAINFSRDQSSDKLIIFLDSQLDARDSRLDPLDSRLDTQNYRGSTIESRGSRIEARGTVNLLLSGTVRRCIFVVLCYSLHCLKRQAECSMSSSINVVHQTNVNGVFLWSVNFGKNFLMFNNV